jgi:putative ABC transport system ATP-binding protein
MPPVGGRAAPSISSRARPIDLASAFIDDERMTTTFPAPARSVAPNAHHDRRPPNAVELRGVTKRHGSRRRGVEALHEVTAEFPRGSFSAVMGLSGSGKSTLLQCAAGLDHPTSGTVRLGGQDLTRLTRRRLSVLRRRQVGFVFQSLNLVPTLSVAENIALPLRLDGRRVDREAVRALAERVGLDSQLRRSPTTLSGGQQQRVAVARALITQPEVVFADEPTASLDPAAGLAVMQLLRHTVDELRQTLVVVTHDPTVAARADRVLLLHGGRLAGVVEARTSAELAELLYEFGQSVGPRGRHRFGGPGSSEDTNAHERSGR